MSQGLQPYRHYKSARVRWLRTIPDHWDQRRGKFLFREVDERSKTGSEEMLSVSHKTGVTPRSEKKVTMFRAESYVGHKLARPGDVVINTMWAWMSALGVARNFGVVSPAYGVYRSLNSDYVPEYLDLLLRIPQLRHEYVCRSTGIRSSRLRLYPDQFLDIAMPIPALDEQRQIVSFIRYKDQQIRRFMRAKQRLIELLSEQKRTIIYQAVTRGLNENASLRPSRIFWLPQVPDHWSIEPIKRQLECLNHMRIPLNANARGAMRERRFPYYGASGIIDYVEDYIFNDDLLLIAEDGANLVLRNLPLAIIARGKFWVNNHAHILKPRRGNLQYFAFLLETISYKPWISGAAQPKLTQDRLLSIPIPVPPVLEQRAIVSYLQDALRPQDAAIDRARREISLINEYRVRLIADLVSGHFDVRQVTVSKIEDDVDDLHPDYLAQPDERLESDQEDMVAVR